MVTLKGSTYLLLYACYGGPPPRFIGAEGVSDTRQVRQVRQVMPRLNWLQLQTLEKRQLLAQTIHQPAAAIEFPLGRGKCRSPLGAVVPSIVKAKNLDTPLGPLCRAKLIRIRAHIDQQLQVFFTPRGS